MIDLHELRIGNWIKDKYDNFITVNSVCEYGINVSTLEGDLYCDFHLDEIFGVPITPEIIERFDKEQIARVGNFFTMIQVNGRWWVGKIDNGIDVKYLHQFQNIFLDYTGEELVIKELQTAT